MTSLRRLLSAAAFLALTASAPAMARPFTAADLVGLDRLSDVHVSPDGQWALYDLRTTDLAANKGAHATYAVRIADGQTVAVGAPGHTSSARWGPQTAGPGGRYTLFYLSDQSGSQQVWRRQVCLLNCVDVPPPQQLTNLPLDVGTFRVSPDGSHLVVSLAVFPDAEDPAATKTRMDARKADKSSGQVFDHLFVRHWDTWADGTRNHLFSIALGGDGTHATPLTPGFDGDVPSQPFGDESDFTISPDGASVYFSARKAGRTEELSTNFDIYRTPVDGGAPPVDLTAENKAWDAGPVVSPDGKTLAYRAMKRPGFESDRFGVRLMDLKTGASREIDTGFDRSFDSLRWSADGKTLYGVVTDDQTGRLYGLEVATGRPYPITTGGHVTEFDLAGPNLVVARDTMAGPAQLYRLHADGSAFAAITHVDADKLAGVEMASYESFSFPGWNGETVHGWVVKPVNYTAGRKYPTAFLIHGGPQGSWEDSWSYRWNPQFYAGLGYAVVMVDFHGSTGYGQAFTDAISGHWGDRPLEDLQKGWVAAQGRFPFIDGQNACALGASYGGFMTYWIAGVWNAPWKCLVDHDGVFDDRMMGYSTEELWFSTWEHGGPDGHLPFQDPAAYERFNPVDHVKDWTKPILVIHSAKDYRIPLEQGLGAFTAAQMKGIESKFLTFPDENHWVLKPKNSLLWHATVADWLKTHLGQ